MTKIKFDSTTQAFAVSVISKADRDRIDAHPLRGGHEDFVSWVLMRGLNQPELVRCEEAAKGGLPDGYYDAVIETVVRVDPERETFDVTVKIDSNGRRLVVLLWYPPDMTRKGPQQHFNVAVGLPPYARIFGRELEVEGARVTLKYWREETPEGVRERVHFLKVADRAA